MTPDRIVTALLVAGVVAGWVRLIRGGVTGQAWWRAATLLILQPVLAGLLYAVLFGGSVQDSAGTLVVATGGTARVVATGPDETLVALPEARGVVGAAPIPDLATALRRWPAVARLRIVGDGLAPRDRPAARTRTVAYSRPSPPAGIVDLVPPPPLSPGAEFAVALRVERIDRVALVDPAGRMVDTGVPDGNGWLTLHGVARDAGAVLFGLRVGDRDVAAVPVVTVATMPSRLLILAGAPGPEAKFLRRWASDAGLAPATRLMVGGGLALGDPEAGITAATLARTDVAILDDRSWGDLGGAARATVAAAVRGGMGLVVRLTGPVPRGWQVLGLPIVTRSRDVPLRLPPAAPTDAALAARRGPGSRDAPAGSAAPLGETPVLTRMDASLDAGVPLLRDANGTSFAAWRAVGRGRVAVSSVLDSFALVTSGNGDAHAQLWSRIASTVARGKAAAARAPQVDPLAFVDERTAICGTRDVTRVRAPNGLETPLIVDPAGGGCAGYWPQMSGWHYLVGRSPETSVALFVQPADALPSLRRMRNQSASAMLAGDRPTMSNTTNPAMPQPSWRWLVPFLAAAGVSWWLERSRLGRSRRMGREGRPPA